MSWRNDFPKENIYFQANNGILYYTDCLSLMKKFPEKSIDLILTDPPFGLEHKKQIWDKIDFLSFTKKWVNIGIRLLNSKGKLAMYYPKKKLILLKEILEDFKECKWDIVIQCKNFGQYRKTYDYIDSWSPILVIHKGFKKIKERFKLRRNWFIVNTANTSKKSENNPRNFHPSAKDVSAFEFLLCLLSNEGDVVLDPFLGSGTTAIACERLNRRWIGIEINEAFCEVAKQRILKETRQLRVYF